jgi:hypothetical protein
MEASKRHGCSELLHEYGYRYRSPEALYAAQNALQRNLGIWSKDAYPDEWCKTKIALGWCEFRLSSFDNEEHLRAHTLNAKKHFEDVRETCSEVYLPNHFARAALNLASVYSARCLAETDSDYEQNLQLRLGLQMSALGYFSESENPLEWGIVQHNLSCTYINLSNLRANESKSVEDIEKAIRHAELSFQVRDPVNDLQYWIASCRTLGEALLNMSTYKLTRNPADYVRQASKVLIDAAAKISATEHPHQWAEIQTQLKRCDGSGSGPPQAGPSLPGCDQRHP